MFVSTNQDAAVGICCDAPLEALHHCVILLMAFLGHSGTVRHDYLMVLPYPILPCYWFTRMLVHCIDWVVLMLICLGVTLFTLR